MENVARQLEQLQDEVAVLRLMLSAITDDFLQLPLIIQHQRIESKLQTTRTDLTQLMRLA